MKRTLLSLLLMFSVFLSACAGQTQKTNADPSGTGAGSQESVYTPVKGLPDNELEDALFNNGLACVKVGDLWGFINAAGEMVIQPRFKGYSKFNAGFAPVSTDQGYGIINTQGEWLIEPFAGYTTNFSEGIAWLRYPVTADDSRITSFRFVAVDAAGVELFTMDNCAACGNFYDGVALFMDINGKIGVIDNTGNFLIEPMFDYVENDERHQTFFEGLMAAAIDDQWGYVDKSGQWVIQPQYESAAPFYNGIARVRVNGKFGYIDKQGNMILEPQFDSYSDLDNGTVLVLEKDGYFGWYDSTGKLLVDHKFRFMSADYFYDGVAPAANDNFDYGLVDISGNWVAQPQYERISRFVCGVTCVEFGSRSYGFMDTKGQILSDETYLFAGFFYDDGYAVAITQDYECVIIGTDGKQVIPEGYDGIANYSFSNDDWGFCPTISGR